MLQLAENQLNIEKTASIATSIGVPFGIMEILIIFDKVNN